MGWAAEGLAWYVQGQKITGLILGGLIAAAGGWPLYSDTVHQLMGKPSTATLIEHIKECTIEYQLVTEKNKRKEPMACDAAETFQRYVGATRIRISAESFALVRFPLADGRTHEAKVYESKLDSYKLPVGAKIAVVYAPNQPAEVRAVLTWDRIKVSLMLFAVGVVVLMLNFAGSIVRLLARAFAGSPTPVDSEPLPAPVVSARAALPAMVSEPRASFGRRK
jgi:hypothetical protein